jgi:hypothetical protein
MNTNRMTSRQLNAIRRMLNRDGSCQLSPDLHKQLAKRGIIEAHRAEWNHTRYEWNRPVATLWKAILTEEAKVFFEQTTA